MLQNKLIGLVVLLLCCGNTAAWTDEVGVASNETLHVDFNPAMNESSVDNPYQFSDSDIMMEPFFIDKYVSSHQITIAYVYTIYKQIWDDDGSMYTQTDCNITIETEVTLSWDSDIEQYVLPPNFNEQMTNGYMVKKYFQDLINSDSEYCSEWNTTDDTTTPDVFYTGIEIDVGDGTTSTAYMYTSIDDRDAQDLASDETPYGYAFAGRGSEGGSGSIYEGIDLYGDGAGDESGLGSAFNCLFFLLIPIIFLLAVVKFVMKIIGGN